ncbi:CCR4-NOT transcription complex subunit 11 [Trichinella patagoniensis]|uniref:CCR4-NOT transcription complex subunit 11 n=1 Tax=Trichinella patagoniensis TaxID=990121 RepID=A0A0V1AE07_9BILA|nr:CCR4-NOT transcription complex subunit 11 [Trichinella patagoniensis]
MASPRNCGLINDDIYELMRILSSYSSETFEWIFGEFEKSFAEVKWFDVATSLGNLLLIPNFTSELIRIVSLFLLFKVFNNECPTKHIFSPLFCILLKNETVTLQNRSYKLLQNVEYIFLKNLITRGVSSVMTMKPSDVVAQNTLEDVDVNVEEFEIQTKRHVLNFLQTSARCDSFRVGEYEQYVAPYQSLVCFGDEILLNRLPVDVDSLRWRFEIPRPSLYYSPNDLIWMDPSSAYYLTPLMLPMSTISPETSVPEQLSGRIFDAQLEQAMVIFKAALENTLPLKNAAQLIEIIRGDNCELFLNNIDLNLDKFSALVELNPQISVEILLKLNSIQRADEYFSKLLCMKISLQSLEGTSFPCGFLLRFVLQCFAFCSQAKDRFVQGNLVRLISLFTVSLLNRKLLAVEEIMIEAQTFCLEFSDVVEAGDLYKLLKQLETETADKL